MGEPAAVIPLWPQGAIYAWSCDEYRVEVCQDRARERLVVTLRMADGETHSGWNDWPRWMRVDREAARLLATVFAERLRDWQVVSFTRLPA